MNIVFRQSRSKFLLALGLIITFGVPMEANAYVISTDEITGTQTEGWDGPGLGSANIDYYLGWSGAPSDDGLDFGGLALSVVESELRNAMNTWEAVADITFNYLGNAADDAISDPGRAADPWGSVGNETLVVYAHGQEAANQFPFDGPGLLSIFAHAFGPPDIPEGFSYAIAGNIHMDGDENWLTGLADGTLYSSVSGIDLETIFLHELGHSLGLGPVLGGNFATVGGPVMDEFSSCALYARGRRHRWHPAAVFLQRTRLERWRSKYMHAGRSSVRTRSIPIPIQTRSPSPSLAHCSFWAPA